MLAIYFYMNAMDVVIALSVILAIVLIVVSFLKYYKSRKLSANVDNALYKEIIKNFGGIDNIEEISFLNSRLYLVLKDFTLFKYEKLEELGAGGVTKSSTKYTVLFGEESKHICEYVLSEKAKSNEEKE